MKHFKEKLEIETLKEMTYTEINALLNSLNDKNKELTEQLALCSVGKQSEQFFAFLGWYLPKIKKQDLIYLFEYWKKNMSK